MKAISTNIINIFIALSYSIFGIITFILLKCSIKYFEYHKKKKSISKNINFTYFTQKQQKSIKTVNVFLKSYLIKCTFVGSFFCQDKKYLLKEIFIFLTMAICCFGINSPIIWPCGVGFGVFLFTTLIMEILIPLFWSKTKNTDSTDRQSDKKISKNSINDIHSIQIEVTQLHSQIIINKEQKEKSSLLTKNIYQLIFIILICVVSQLLICQCILNLSLSISNSGYLNIVSLAISFSVDQIAVRLGVGFISVVIVAIIDKNKNENVSLIKNNLFLSFCYEEVAKQIQQIKLEELKSRVNEKDSEIIKSNQVIIEQQQSRKQFMLQVIFESYSQQNLASENQSDAVTQQKPQPQSQLLSMIEEKQLINDAQIVNQSNQSNQYELFQQDLQLFTQQWMDIQRPQKQLVKRKQTNKSQTIKLDRLIYFPYQQHKGKAVINTGRSHHNQENQENQQIRWDQSIQIKELSKINLEDFKQEKKDENNENNDDSNKEFQQVRPVLSLPKIEIIVNRPEIMTIDRDSELGRKQPIKINSKKTKSMKKIKKVSPYFVNLSSQVINPKKKSKKILISNKQNIKVEMNSQVQQKKHQQFRINNHNHQPGIKILQIHDIN